MFGISGTELMIILFFGFLIFGPEKLPQLGRTVGRAIRQFRDASEAANKKFKEQVADPFHDAIAPYKDQVEESTKPFQEDIAAINSTLNETKSMFTDPFKDILSPSPKKAAAEKTGAVISTGVALDDPDAGADPFAADSDNPATLSDRSEPKGPDADPSIAAPTVSAQDGAADAQDTFAQDDAVESKPLPTSGGTVKKSLAASLYDLDDEGGE